MGGGGGVIEKSCESEKSGDKYRREIKPGVVVDVYDVLTAFGVACPGRQQAIKKLLFTGMRGHKNAVTDLKEARDAIDRAIELAGQI